MVNGQVIQRIKYLIVSFAEWAGWLTIVDKRIIERYQKFAGSYQTKHASTPEVTEAPKEEPVLSESPSPARKSPSFTAGKGDEAIQGQSSDVFTDVGQLFWLAKMGLKEAENRLFEVLSKRLLVRARNSLSGIFRNLDRRELERQAQDIVQETLMVIAQKYKKYTSEDYGTDFYAWTLMVLRNIIGNSLKKERRRERTHFVEVPPLYDSEEKLEYKELIEAIRQSIGKLDTPCRQILQVFSEGGTRRDILQLFPEKTQGYVDNKVFRCRQKLKKILQEQGFKL